MSNNMKTRIARLEGVMTPPPPSKWIRTFSNQYGVGSEIIREETDQQVMTRHLVEHPEDKGCELNIINRVIIHPNGVHRDGKNAR
jgi:hypothetical protein